MDANSTRSELMGLLAVVSYLSHLQYDGAAVKTKEIIICIDSQSAINSGYETDRYSTKSIFKCCKIFYNYKI